MKQTIHTSLIMLLLSMAAALSSCSGDEPRDVSENDILGIWQDSPGHILDMADSERLYEYTLQDFEGTKYWVRTTPMYFYEPRTELMLKELKPEPEAEDPNSQMHVYKVIDIAPEELTICWVAQQDVSNIDGENVVEIFQVFFDKDYVVDPSNYTTFRRLTPDQFKAALGDIEVID